MHEKLILGAIGAGSVIGPVVLAQMTLFAENIAAIDSPGEQITITGMVVGGAVWAVKYLTGLYAQSQQANAEKDQLILNMHQQQLAQADASTTKLIEVMRETQAIKLQVVQHLQAAEARHDDVLTELKALVDRMDRRRE